MTAYNATGLARESLAHYLKNGQLLDTPSELQPELLGQAGVFVSLKKAGQLRGCIGTFTSTRATIAEEIIQNAVSAGTQDPRFWPVEAAELNELTVSVDILSQPEPVEGMDKLDPKCYGIVVHSGRRTGLLLPDLDGVNTVEQQVEIARQKAGIRPEEAVELYRFTVTRYS